MTARDREERGLTEKKEKTDKPRVGNTIFVQGFQITEDLLRKAFMNCGLIINISMEVEKELVFDFYFHLLLCVFCLSSNFSVLLLVEVLLLSKQKKLLSVLLLR